MPISALLQTASVLPSSMLYRPRTNPIFTKQAQFCYPLFTKYDQQNATKFLLRSVQRLHCHTALNLKSDCLELETENPNDHVHRFLQTVSDFTKARKKMLLSVIIGVVSVCYSYKAFAASGGVMGGDSFSSYSSSGRSSSSSSRSSSSSSRSSDSSSSSSSSSSSEPWSSSSSSWSSDSSSSSSSSSQPWSSSPSSRSSDSSSSSSSSSQPWSSSSSSRSSDSSSDCLIDYLLILPKLLSSSKSSKSKKYTASTSVMLASPTEEYTASTSVVLAPQTVSTKTRFKAVLGFSIIMVSILGMVALCIIAEKTTEKTTEKTLEKTSVIKLQVALLGSARSFQRDINQIAKVADTSTRRGRKNILTETSLALLRHSDCWASSHLSVSEEQCIKDGEKRYSKLSFEERSKFDQDTVVNLNNFRKEEKLRQQFDDPSHDFIVVTFLVAALGFLELQSIESRADLTAIVQKLNSIPVKEILAVQVLWTPQNENDTLSSQRVLKDYPLLNPLQQ